MLMTLRTCLLAMSVAALTPTVVAQPVLPATPQGDTVKALLEALNSPDPADIQRVDPRAAGMRAESGGYDLISVEPESVADQITVVLRDRTFGNHQKFTYTFAPGGTNIVGLRSGPAPNAPVVARVDDTARAALVADAGRGGGESHT